MNVRALVAAAGATALLTWTSAVASAASSPALGVPVGQGSLGGVSCPATDDCWAVGEGGSPQTHPPGILAAELWHGDGKHWTSVQVPLPRAIWPTPDQTLTSGDDGLSGVACVSRTSCWAVGWYSGEHPLGGGFFANFVLHYDGQAWTETLVPSPAGMIEGGLLSVACTKAADCWAVGAAGNPAVGRQPQALHWNGHAWTMAALPVRQGNLYGVDCAGGTCWAVGSLGRNNLGPGRSPGKGAIVLRLVRGRATGAPVPATVARELLDVACTTARQCLAVGTTKAGNSVGVRWSGAAVKRSALVGVTTPYAVACTTSSNCWVAGSDGILHGNGKSWTAVHFPKPLHATHVTVYALRCRSASSCWAVGSWYGDQETNLGNINGSTAAFWNGSAWRLR